MKSNKTIRALPAPKSNGTLTREAPEERELMVRDFEQFNQPAVNEAQFKALYERTPEHAIFTREGKGGKSFRYIKHGYVSDRLNKAFGFSWSFELLPITGGDSFVLQVYDEETRKGNKQVRDISVLGRLTVNFFDKSMKLITTCSKSGFGSQRWEMGTEFGDALKGAASDAKKSCAKELGIGLDLYYDDEAAIEAHEASAKRQAELQAELDAFNAPPPAWLVKAQALKAQGKTRKEIASACGVSMGEVNQWLKE